MCCVAIKAQDTNHDSISIREISALDSLKLDLEKAIQILNAEESEAISPYDSISKIIEIQLKNDSGKKLFGKLSPKKKHELQDKLHLQKAMIGFQSTLYEKLRSDKYADYYTKLDSIKRENYIEQKPAHNKLE